MVWRIVKKELLVNLLSLRFALGLVITTALMGLVGYVLMEDYVQRRQRYLENVQRHEEQLKNFKVYSVIQVHADIPPSPLSIFSRPLRELSSSARVSPYRLPSLVDGEAGAYGIGLEGQRPATSNPLLRVFSTIDLTFVIYSFLSLLAVLLVFDSFSGEKELGTLPLIMACPVGRLQVLAGKFLGALISVAVPLALGFLAVLLMWSLSPSIALDREVWDGVGAIFLVSLLFLAGFIALGLFLSLCAEESSQALVVLLMAWVAIAVAIPQGGSYLAQYARPQVSRARFAEEMERALKEFYQDYEKIEYEQKGGWWHNNTSDLEGQQLLATTEEEMHNLVRAHRERAPLRFRYAEERYRAAEAYERELRQWGKLREALVSLSLSELYQNVVRALAATDTESYDRVLAQTRRYRGELVDYLRPKAGTPQWFTRLPEYPDLFSSEENVAYWRKLQEEGGWGLVQEKVLNWERIAPLDLSDMPRLRVEYPGVGERLERVMGKVLLMVGFAALFLGLAARQVLRYAMR
jgi:ABC-type transport system involved in multi-copper enzyme maturation permease subunit